MLSILLWLGHVIGWDLTWSSFDVTPLNPPFFDMHVIMDYAACAAKGVDPYVPHSCNAMNFNIPPAWLWLGRLGFDGSDSTWLSAVIIACAAGVMVALFKGRSVSDGLIAVIAILSPSVLMGVERGNLDLLILALVGGAALVFDERNKPRAAIAIALISLGFILKLIPVFSIALAARFNRSTLRFAVAIAALFLVYAGAIFEDMLLIRSNVPTTFILSYGYKAVFLGLDHLRAAAGLSPVGLADTWLPIVVSTLAVIGAAATALITFRRGRISCTIADGVAGTAFCFGSGIYCGTYLLGTNFIYRLMFLLLCVPQLQDWQAHKSETKEQVFTIERALLIMVLSVLWLNGNANGQISFLLVPQLIDWLLFYALTAVLLCNLINNVGLAVRSESNQTRD